MELFNEEALSTTTNSGSKNNFLEMGESSKNHTVYLASGHRFLNPILLGLGGRGGQNHKHFCFFLHQIVHIH